MKADQYLVNVGKLNPTKEKIPIDRDNQMTMMSIRHTRRMQKIMIASPFLFVHV